MTRHARLGAITAVGFLAMAAAASAQTYATMPPQLSQQTGPQSGALVIQARLDDRVSTKHSDPGDRFRAEVVTPVVDQHGRVLVPAGASVHGHVVVAERGHHLEGNATIILGAESLHVHGTTIPIAAEVSAPMYTWRSGVRQRERGEIAEGTVLQIRLAGPLPVAALREAMGERAIGGGP